MIRWCFGNKTIENLYSFVDIGYQLENLYGFIYKIGFEEGSYYIGKKNFWFTTELPILKTGDKRPGHVKYVKHIKDGHKVSYEITRKESDWLNYVGSSKEVDGLIPVSRTILELCFSKRQLTYKEVWWQFKLDVLVNTQYLNGNILNKFFRNNLI